MTLELVRGSDSRIVAVKISSTNIRAKIKGTSGRSEARVAIGASVHGRQTDKETDEATKKPFD